MAEEEAGFLVKLGVDSKEFEGGLNKASGALKDFGVDLGALQEIITGPVGIITAAAALGAEFVKAMQEIGDAFDDANNIIAKKTGETGDALKGLNESMRSVMSEGVEASTQDLATAIGELNTRLGLTGDELTKITADMAEFADVTETNLVQDVKDITRLMQKWNIEASAMPELLEKITLAGQKSGVNINSLNQTLTASATQLKAMGFTLDQSIGLLSGFELAGVKTDSVMAGLNKAYAKFSELGLDAKENFLGVVEAIKNTGDTAEAVSLAVSVFGAKAGPELATAIRSGKFELEKWVELLEKAPGTMAKTGAAAESLEELQKQWANKQNAMWAGIGEAMVNFQKESLRFKMSGDIIGGVLHDLSLGLIPKFTEGLVNLKNAVLPDLISEFNKTGESIKNALADFFSGDPEKVGKMFSNLGKGISDTFSNLGTNIGYTFDGIKNSIFSTATVAKEEYSTVPYYVSNAIMQASNDILKYNQMVSEYTVRQLEQAKKNMTAALAGVPSDVRKGLTESKEIQEKFTKETEQNKKKSAAEYKKIMEATDKDTAKKRREFELEFQKKATDDRIEQLEIEKQQALEKARELKADEKAVNKYYDTEILKEKEKKWKEQSKFSKEWQKQELLSEGRFLDAATVAWEEYYETVKNQTIDFSAIFSTTMEGVKSVAGTAFDIIGKGLMGQGFAWENLAKVTKKAIADIARAIGAQLAAKAAAEAVEAAASFMFPPVAAAHAASAGIYSGGAIAAYAAAAGIEALAKGTRNFAGGVALVGEQGPELVSMPKGSQVYTANETKNMMNKNSNYNVTIVASETLDLRQAKREMIALNRRLAQGIA